MLNVQVTEIQNISVQVFWANVVKNISVLQPEGATRAVDTELLH